ncbi:transcriptional regulator, TetR family [Bosea sp. OK403]|uniref:TetR/AcrR family transcriptional regulator n=1 Tax=Bosea sp. OK403 TaxID=1855286 RepID=UPI0008DEE0E7|nr:TetR/AcrR family transcriptional regulator [Bosea sp. OK403]SFJ59014.1 transcriptional regulator, TetR family [Bosea sp. OK403]
MPEALTVRRSASLTRQRILEAAILRFSRSSYEATTLRDIAADVGIDVALVHRSFGSKEELFRQAARVALDDGFQRAVEAPDLGAAMAAHFLQPRLDQALKMVDPLDIVTHSLSSDRANPILRELVQQDFILPLTQRLGCGDELQAALAIACLAGIALLRDVLCIGVLRDASKDQICPMIEKLMHACLAKDCEPQLSEPSS